MVCSSVNSGTAQQTCNQLEFGKLHILLGNSMTENKALARCPEYIAEVGWVRSRKELEQKI